jgi:CAP12/Pycsar effector protein, TIR domain
VGLTRRVFISLPADPWLSNEENELKWAIVQRVEALETVAEIFTDPRGTRSLAAGSGWSADRADEVMRHCVGAVLIGMPRWTFTDTDGRVVHLPTEFCHYEGAVARTLRLPTLVLVREDSLRRVVFDGSLGGWVAVIPKGATRSWLDTPAFETPFEYWRSRLNERRDVFLGYCGASSKAARKVKRWLVDHGVSVLDWQTDFVPGNSILVQIEDASARCRFGIFLFTKDDELMTTSANGLAAPRDNVVFEAGYFVSSKGKESVLILREAGAKMPADLGGDIYGSFDDRQHLGSAFETLERFLGSA